MQWWRQPTGSSALPGEGTISSFVTSAEGAGGTDVSVFVVWKKGWVQKKKTSLFFFI